MGSVHAHAPHAAYAVVLPASVGSSALDHGRPYAHGMLAAGRPAVHASVGLSQRLCVVVVAVGVGLVVVDLVEPYCSVVVDHR